MWLRPAVSALALAAWTLAWGQAGEPPERILRLSHVEGDVAVQAPDGRALSTLPTRPLMQGDRVTTEVGARAELALDASAIRLDELTELHVETLDPTRVQLALDRGVLNFRLRELFAGERLEIATANVSLTLREPGEFRLEARAPDLAVLTVRGGAADVATAGGLVRVAGGQRVILEGRDARATLVTPVATDAFDDWVLDREVQLADAALPASPDDSGAYGERAYRGSWYDDATYGHAWMADYSYGSTPWVFFSFSSGHWAFSHGQGRWCWVPGQPTHQPAQVAQETHPFGRARTAVSRSSIADGGPAVPGARTTTRAASRYGFSTHSFGSMGSSRPSGSTTQGHTATMRPSGSSSRPRTSTSTPSSSQPSAFGVPTYSPR